MMRRDDWVAQSVGKVNGTTLNHPAFREKVEKIEADIDETHQRLLGIINPPKDVDETEPPEPKGVDETADVENLDETEYPEPEMEIDEFLTKRNAHLMSLFEKLPIHLEDGKPKTLGYFDGMLFDMPGKMTVTVQLTENTPQQKVLKFYVRVEMTGAQSQQVLDTCHEGDNRTRSFYEILEATIDSRYEDGVLKEAKIHRGYDALHHIKAGVTLTNTAQFEEDRKRGLVYNEIGSDKIVLNMRLAHVLTLVAEKIGAPDGSRFLLNNRAHPHDLYGLHLDADSPTEAIKRREQEMQTDDGSADLKRSQLLSHMILGDIQVRDAARPDKDRFEKEILTENLPRYEEQVEPEFYKKIQDAHVYVQKNISDMLGEIRNYLHNSPIANYTPHGQEDDERDFDTANIYENLNRLSPEEQEDQDAIKERLAPKVTKFFNAFALVLGARYRNYSKIIPDATIEPDIEELMKLLTNVRNFELLHTILEI